ncbi:hypothetical protein Dthio_PD0721 [Desulfonatronospira thiodismutans ASO3-1]|uniref:Transposase IS200-like domain-containing protein n=1 Tax=Desulfonatronospira thiodismutans ASO3-1 TaxID=555779 RepID=D6SRS4_9BACT|nr:hypothetical protein Dthio_PD0721 [Desulfonatronospira thiodismutans ASO3-1]
MPRNARFTLPHRPTVYHVISRTALSGLPLGDIEKNRLLEIIKYFSSIYFVDVLGFCIMGNHWHLAVKIYPRDYATRETNRDRQNILDFHPHFGYLFFHRHQPSPHGGSPCQETPDLPCLTGPRSIT